MFSGRGKLVVLLIFYLMVLKRDKSEVLMESEQFGVNMMSLRMNVALRDGARSLDVFCLRFSDEESG
jgi:hypothetical protein